MANQNRRNGKGRSKDGRDPSGSRRAPRFFPLPEVLEARRLLTIAINEFGGSNTVTNPAGIALGTDGNLWFTESSAAAGAIGRITPSGAITNYSYGLTSGATPTGIALGSDDALWFTDPGNDDIGRIDNAGNITEYPVTTPNAYPDQITAGPDGDLWFTERDSDKIGRIDTSGNVTEFTIPTANSQPVGIAEGADGNLWFTESAGNKIGRMTPTGQFTEFSIGITANSGLDGITPGPDGALWFTEQTADQIGRITLLGAVTEFSAGITPGASPTGITAGPDGQLWFTEAGIGKVGAITTEGSVSEYTSAAVSPTSNPDGIATGSDGNLWFTEFQGNHVDRITTTGTITQFPPPPSQTIGSDAYPYSIASGPDGALWFTENSADEIGRIDTSGAITQFSTGITANAGLNTIVEGPANGGTPNLYFTESGVNKLGEITTAGAVTEFPIGVLDGSPQGITLGPDGNLWVLEDITSSSSQPHAPYSTSPPAILSFSPTGTLVDDFTLPVQYAGDTLNQIATGPDGALWFTLYSGSGGAIGRVTTGGTFSFFAIANGPNGAVSDPFGITKGSGVSDEVWFADPGNSAIGEVTTGGTVDEYSQGLTSSDVPTGITNGPDGNFWFTDPSDFSDPIGSITPQGVITLYQTPTSFAGPIGITTGPDNNIWFTEAEAGQIGQAVLPQGIVDPLGNDAGVVASIPSTFVIATFSDSVATNAANFSAEISYGDGTSGPGTVVELPDDPGHFEVIGSHTYGSVATFTADVTISTGTGSLAPLTAKVASSNPIQLTGLGVDGIAGRRSNTLVGTFTDLDTSATVADFAATINWADGTSSAGFVYEFTSAVGGPQFAVYAGHTFDAPGSYVDSVTVTDIRNSLSGVASSGATIAPTPTSTPFNEFGPDSLTPGAGATSITEGPDDALWFTEDNSDKIGRITTSGAVTEYPIPTPDSEPTGITLGPDGALWFTESAASQIGRITTTGSIEEFSTGITSGSEPGSITLGPDGNLWFTEFGDDQIARITPQGVVTEFSGLPPGFLPDSITAEPGGALWFVGRGSDLIGRITTQGTLSFYSGATGTGFLSITQGPDGDLWFTETSSNLIGKIDPTSHLVTEYSDPSIVEPVAISPGPDGNLYFTGGGNTPQVDQITTSGVVTPFSVGLTLDSQLGGITSGPDGNVYFTEIAGDRIGQLVFPQGIIDVTGVPANTLATVPSTYEVATFTDLSGAFNASNFTATIDYGDGTTGPGDILESAASPGTYEVLGDHTYGSVGTFTDTITIGTAVGSLAPVSSTVYAGNPISVNSTSIDGIAGRRSNTGLGTFSDADLTAVPGDFTVTVNWGDGTSSTGYVYQTSTGTSEAEPSEFAIRAGHDYAEAGNYNLTITVQDDRNGVSAEGETFSIISASPSFAAINEIGPDSLTPGASPVGIAAGPDGALWFTESLSDKIGRMTTSGTVTEYPIPTAYSDPTGIAAGPGNTLWFTESAADQIGEITTSGTITEFWNGLSSGADPNSITLGPDGNLWFTEPGLDQIGRITPQGVITEFSSSLLASYQPSSITSADGDLWFVGTGSNEIGEITPQGVITLHPGLTGYAFNAINSITRGPDGDLWFTVPEFDEIGKLNPVTLQVTLYPTGEGVLNPTQIASGPDGNLYFSGGSNLAQVGEITTAGVVTPLSAGLTMNADQAGLVAGPDGNVYFAETGGDRIGQIVLPQTSLTSLVGQPITAVVGHTFSGTVATFTEASTIPTTANFDAAINWGDGSSADVVVTMGSDGEFTVNDSHVYTTPGSYTGTISIFNDAGSKLTTFQVDVQPVIVVTGRSIDVPANRLFTMPVASFTDANGLQPPSAFQLTIDWGDGTSSIGTLALNDVGGYDVLGTHDYPYPGNYQVTTTVQVIGESSEVGTGTSTATVTAAILSASVPTIQASAGTAFDGVVAYVVDSTGLDLASGAYEAAINWGDGTAETGGTIVPLNANAFEVVGSHTYAAAGSFPLGVTVVKTATADIAAAVGLAEVTSTPPLSFVVINTNDSGTGSLRQAIIDADLVGGHAITFAIPTLGVATIGITSPLPMITGPTFIDGTTQGQFERIVPTQPLIEVDGQGAGSGSVDGLTFGAYSAGSLLQDVSIYGFSGAQVEIESPNITLYGNDVGLRADGSIPATPGGVSRSPNLSNRGIEVVAPGAVIGGAFPGEGNAISGNDGWGILINGAPATSARIVGDEIGLNPTGAVATPNLLDGVAVIGGASHEFIGPGNTISGNSGNGILLLASFDDLVSGNFIGALSEGNKAFGNGDFGIDLDQASYSILIGGTDPLSPNVISGNNVVGVGIQGGSTNITLERNRIGTDVQGQQAVGNGIAGVLISDSPGNIVGPGNVISGNGTNLPGAGVWIDGPGSMFNLVEGNRIGTDISGQYAIPNTEIGVLINQASDNVVGGDTVGSTNLISGNTSIGIMIAGPGASHNLVAGNLVGTNAEGSTAIGNGSSTQGAGVYIDNASSNVIGGPLGSGNLISGNKFDGVQVFGPASIGNVIEGNGVGTDLSGTARLGNTEDGLLVNDAPGTQIIGNLSSANGLDGITVSGADSTGTLIQDNLIGQGIGGQALGNGTFGILIINGAPSPTLVNNVNVNNADGPIRNTGVDAASVSASSVSVSSTATTATEKVAVVHGQAVPSGARSHQVRAKSSKKK